MNSIVLGMASPFGWNVPRIVSFVAFVYFDNTDSALGAVQPAVLATPPVAPPGVRDEAACAPAAVRPQAPRHALVLPGWVPERRPLELSRARGALAEAAKV
jgi:hypothetical protein